jgi:predicted RNase H-like HicB family nuclease
VVFERRQCNWSADVPDLPGCVAAAYTRNETEQLIREAIEFHIAGLKLHGDPVPEPVSEAQNVRVSA